MAPIERVNVTSTQTPTTEDWESWFNRAIDKLNAGVSAADIIKDVAGKVAINISGDAATVGGKTADQLIAGDFPDIKRMLIEMLVGNTQDNITLHGGLASKDGVTANKLNITAVKAVQKKDADGTFNRVDLAAASKFTSAPSSLYYLGVQPGAVDYYWSVTAPTGDYLPLAQVTTDGAANISVVTDLRVMTGTMFAGLDAAIKASDSVKVGGVDLAGLDTRFIRMTSQYVTPSSAANAAATVWSKIATVTLAAQNTSGSAKFTVLPAHWQGSAAPFAQLSFRVVQVAAMGSNPVVTLDILDTKQFVEADFKAIATTVSGAASTVDLWIRNLGTNETWSIRPDQVEGDVKPTFLTNQAWTVTGSLPAGPQFGAVYQNIFVTDSTVSGKLTTPQTRLGDANSMIVDKKFYISFPNGLSSQKIDMFFPASMAFSGALEITVTAGFSSANAAGMLRKIYGFVGSNTGTINHQTAYYSDAVGLIRNEFAVSDITWDSTNSRYRIQVVHLTSTGNIVTVHVRGFASGQGVNDVAFLDGSSIGAIYTTDTTVFTAPMVTFPSPIDGQVRFNQLIRGNGTFDVMTLNGTSGAEFRAGNTVDMYINDTNTAGNTQRFRVAAKAGSKFVLMVDENGEIWSSRIGGTGSYVVLNRNAKTTMIQYVNSFTGTSTFSTGSTTGWNKIGTVTFPQVFTGQVFVVLSMNDFPLAVNGDVATGSVTTSGFDVWANVGTTSVSPTISWLAYGEV